MAHQRRHRTDTSEDTVEQQKVSLTGARATMLGTLYLRAKASRATDPILVDPHAETAVDRIDYDFEKLKVSRFDPNSVAVRINAIDRWVRRVIEAQPDLTVLHLGCGLDTRVFRLDPPPTVEWYDVDFPEVIELHRALFPEREHHHTIGSSVTDPYLLEQIPTDKPVLVVAEGLTMYLSDHDGIQLLRRITEHFTSGQLVFDAFSRLNIRLSNRFNAVVVGAGATLQWGVDDPHELERAVPALTFAEAWSFADAPEIARYPWYFRAMVRALCAIPTLRKVGRVLHYRF